MKKLLITLFLLTSIFAIFNPTFISAAQVSFDEATPFDINDANLCRYIWQKYDDSLTLYVKVADELEFYDLNALDVTNGKGYEISFFPLGGKMTSSEGYPLKKGILKVEVLNAGSPYLVDYTNYLQLFYEGINKEGNRVYFTRQFKIQGVLKTSAIDLTQDPYFYGLINFSHEGGIVFKNAFHNSN